MNKGFYISKLIVVGSQQSSAKIKFETGLNVISGPSNTGKSYVFACINFMLGGGDPPKQIPESIGYTNIYLEIVTFSGKTYTLKRSISGGKFQLKEVEAEKFETNGIAKILQEKHSEYNTDNISDFLLNISGFENKEVRLNANNAKRDLSYRDIANLSIIDESKIIVERSPVYASGQYNFQSAEQFVLQLLLTGLDASALKEIEDVKVYKGRIQGKIEFIDKLILETQTKIDQINSPEQQQKITNYSKRLEELSAVIVDTSEQLEQSKMRQQTFFNDLNALESEELLSKELNSRFVLLNEQYDSDLNRLNFLIEGESYLSQLVTVNCPLCGNDLDNDHKSCLDNNVSKDESILNAIRIESQKIKIKKADLESTIANNKIESNYRLEQIELKKNALQEISQKIKDTLEPIRAASKMEIEDIILQQSIIKELEIAVIQIDNYNKIRESLSAELNSKSTKIDNSNSVSISRIQDLCDVMANVLKNWSYSPSVSVTFNQAYKIFDFIINDVERKANGKGIRAVMYSAFVYALMEYCIKLNLAHPRNIILDSPLTTYHGVDTPIETDDAPVSLQNAFFDDLSKLPSDRQVIVFDNKQPTPEILDKINYIRFTKNPNIGRAGFFQ